MNDFTFSILDWFYKNKRFMPWRETRNPYHIWLSEVMLQQTQVATVIPYFNRFIEKYPGLSDLAQASDDDVLKLWEGLGYYRRCHHFLKAVREVQSTFGGRIPEDPDVFLKLPGVGEYTCAAVMSIAFGKPLPVVDGNVVRVIARYERIGEDSSKPSTRKMIHGRMKALIPHDFPGDFNQAVMELGALVCTPKKPECPVCPLGKGCGAFLDGTVPLYPNTPKKEKIPEYQVGLAAIIRGGKILIQKRPSTGHLAGMWEFPGGKCEKGESPETALKRKCREELGVDVSIIREIACASHVYSHFRIRVTVYLCRVSDFEINPQQDQPVMWITTDEIDQYPFPAVNHRFFPELKKQIDAL